MQHAYSVVHYCIQFEKLGNKITEKIRIYVVDHMLDKVGNLFECFAQQEATSHPTKLKFSEFLRMMETCFGVCVQCMSKIVH